VEAQAEAHVSSHSDPENIQLENAITHARRSRRWNWILLPLAPFILLLDWVSEKWSAGSTENEDSNDRKSRKVQFSVQQQLRKIFLNSWAHVLLFLIPAGFAVYYTGQNAIAVFFINFAAMIPSIMIMAMAVENILMYAGELLGGLISTTFSNAAQLITSVLLLRTHQLKVLRTSLVGAILSNLLLMPGLAFFFGGFNRMEQYFNITVAQTTGEMLLLAILSLMIPSAGNYLTNTTQEGIVKQSRGTAIILLVCYGAFMFFQLKTHMVMYAEPSQKTPKRPRFANVDEAGIKSIFVTPSPPNDEPRNQTASNDEDEDEDDEDVPELPLLTSLAVLSAFTVLLTFSTLFATNSIQELLLRLNISETFLGIVVLPIISNDPTTVMIAVKDRQDLMLGLTLGRCVQIALLVIPFIVLLAWMIGIDDMSLSFDAFETLIMLTSVLVVNYIIQDGKSHWLVGALLVASYLIVSVSAYYIPSG
jgi:Ca2+:H+ antiporter